MVDGGGDLGQQGRVSIGDAGDEQADADVAGGHRHRGQQLPAVEDRSIVADRPDRRQVIHRPAVVEVGLVGDLPDRPVTLDGRILGEIDTDSQWLCHRRSSTFVNRSGLVVATRGSLRWLWRRARRYLEDMVSGSRVVYSTDDGDLRRAPDRALRERRADGDRVRVRREVAGRRGKAVTTVSGVPVDDAGLKQLATKLKKRCGVGGSVKNGVIEIQGDHRDVVMQVLEAEGYRPVLAGG